MGVRAGVVVCAVSFLLGALFTHWIADSLTLWKSPVTEQNLWTAASYYAIIAKGHIYLHYFVAAVVSIGGVTILWNLRDGEAGNLMFDGGSIFLFATTVALYNYSVIPKILTVFSSLPMHQPNDAVPEDLRSTILELASNNLICSVALTGVLGLQAGRFWAENSSDDDAEDLVDDRGKSPPLESGAESS
ncbi:hypothetical protein D9758_003205 [Tetrapyrgos nigripes]|uniref:Shr3 amino acid permease chaperone n=1 Tax=Tetrapyrgos nigripes TaxID=182062 RepID=A0A8H5GIR0_9AGAR|nr:hypothetical protein D9758_003205 [Tetrapyrgos nigripes]